MSYKALPTTSDTLMHDHGCYCSNKSLDENYGSLYKLIEITEREVKYFLLSLKKNLKFKNPKHCPAKSGKYPAWLMLTM